MHTIKTKIESLLRPYLVNFPIHPTILTGIGSIFPLLFFFFFLEKQYVFALVAFLGTSFDMFDGIVARATKKTSPFGALLDSTLDRVSDFFIIASFGFANAVSWSYVLPLLLFSFLTSYLRAKGEKDMPQVSFAVGPIERPQRIVLLFLAFFSFAFFPHLAIASIPLGEILIFILIFLSALTCLRRLLIAYHR